MENNKTSDFGTFAGIIIVIIILIVGAFYFVGQRMEKSREFQAAIQKEVAAAASSSISTSSDEITDLEKEANSMNFDDLGTGIDSL